MKLSNLKPAKGSVKSRKRIARGQGSGSAGTAGRGHNGAKSRSGYSKKIGFEGGQMPLQRRVPKFGFTNPNRVEYVGVNVSILQDLSDRKKLENITFADLCENGLVGTRQLVKILGGGELTKKLNVEAHAFSASAKEVIEKNGGTATALK
jgi:large subunit ribosomal protein L15